MITRILAFLLSAVGVLLISGTNAWPQGGWIMLAADPAGLSCEFQNSPGSLNFVYQIHMSSPGTTLSRYALAPSNPAAFVWVLDNYVPNAAIGSAPTGVAVAYGACKVSPLVIGFSGYTMLASTQCEYLDVVPDPAAPSGKIESIDCTLPTPITYEAGCSITTFNPNGAYTCNPNCGQTGPGGGSECGQTVPVRDSSWGRIKALYE